MLAGVEVPAAAAPLPTAVTVPATVAGTMSETTVALDVSLGPCTV